jgi:hypothetical protein
MMGLEELIMYGNSDITSESLIMLGESDFVKKLKQVDVHATSVCDTGKFLFYFYNSCD